MLPLECIVLEQRDIVEIDQFFRRQLMQLRIDFDRNDGRRPFGDEGRERPGARADFQHDIILRNLGRLGQQPQQVQISKKILPMPCLEMYPHLGKPPLEKRDRLIL